MSTTGVLVSGRRRRRLTAASVARFASVARDPQSYRNLLYLALALPLGIAYVAILVAGLSAGAGLAVILVGLVLLIATLFALRAMAAVERMLARRLLRIAIHPPIEGGIHFTWRQRVQLWLRDPVTWKSLVYLLGKLPMGIVAYAAIVLLGLTSVVLTFAPAPRRVHAGDLLRLGDRQPRRGDRGRAGRRACCSCSACTCSTGWRGSTASARASCSARARSTCASASRASRTPAPASSPPPTTSAAGSSATSTTAPSSGSWRSTCCSGWSRPSSRRTRPAAGPLVARAREEATEAVKELRELARGIHPALLADRGLIAALEALAARAPFNVEISGVPEHRLPPAVEATAYFITAEALTNVAKYAGDEATATVALVEDRGAPARDGARRRQRRRRPAPRHRPARAQRPRRRARRALRGHLPAGRRDDRRRRAAAGAPVRRAARPPRRAGGRRGARRLRQRPARLPDPRSGRLHAPGGLGRPLARHPPASTAPTPGVRITAGTKAIDRIKTEVVGDVLRVSTKSRGLTIGPDPLGDVSISLGVPALLALRVDGQADVDLSGLSAKTFELRVDGSGLVRARGPRRRPRDGGRRLGRHGPGRPRDAERERAHRRVGRRGAAGGALARADRRGQRRRDLPRPPVRQLAPRGLGQRAPDRPD